MTLNVCLIYYVLKKSCQIEKNRISNYWVNLRPVTQFTSILVEVLTPYLQDSTLALFNDTIS